jgi:hypothetical protein
MSDTRGPRVARALDHEFDQDGTPDGYQLAAEWNNGATGGRGGYYCPECDTARNDPAVLRQRTSTADPWPQASRACRHTDTRTNRVITYVSLRGGPWTQQEDSVAPDDE